MNTRDQYIESDSFHDEPMKPSTIMQHVYGAYPSFAMLAGMQLDLFTPLKDGPMEVKTLAKSLNVQEEKLTPLLYSLVAAGLLKMDNKSFANTREADKFLVRGRPDYMGGLSGFYNKLWHATLNTAESIRMGTPKAKLDWRTLPEEELLKFFQSQFHSSRRSGKEIANRLDFSEFESLLDAGGGTGGVAIAICEKFPLIKATVADLPKVAQLAERFITEAGMTDRISVSATDICLEPPEGRFDVAILRAVIQTLSKEQAQLSLKSISHSMVPGGRIFIFGSVLENSCLAPPSSLANGLVFLNLYDYGKAYTENEYQEMLTNAGFIDITVEHDALVDGMGIVKAKKQ
jgi:hypothetical protein